MSLKNQLNQILPDILPANPKDAIKGTELIRMIRMKIDGNYADASLRYHFSVMSCDPSSSIAKVEQGQGYYRRTAATPVLSSARELISLTQGSLDDLENREIIDVAMSRIKKFRALTRLWAEQNGLFPFVFSKVFKDTAHIETLWKYPEMVHVNWEDPLNFDRAEELFNMKRSLDLPLFQLNAIRIRLQANIEHIREDFYQTLSASDWANSGELIYAFPIEDEALANTLRRLSSIYGVGVTTLGLTPEVLDDLPRAAAILNAHPSEIEALMSKISINRIAPSRRRSHIDWSAISALRGESEEILSLFKWLYAGTQSKDPQPYDEGKY